MNFLSFNNISLYNFNKVVQSWNTNFIQLSPGNFYADMKQCVCKDFQLGYVKFNKVVKQEGISPKGIWTFSFVNEVKIYWRNYKVQSNAIIIYSPGSEINAVSDSNFEVMTFSISENYLLEIAKKEKLEKFFDNLKTMDLMVTNNSLWNSLRNSIMEQIIKNEKNFGTKNFHDFKESFTKKLILLLIDSKANTDKVSGKKRLKLLQDFEHYILEHITNHIKIRDIASLLNVSERTLLYACRNRFDMGPKAYLNILRLNHVHHRLSNNKNDGPISTIARESGFWHIGQFNIDYEKFFGELPSKTFQTNIDEK